MQRREFIALATSGAAGVTIGRSGIARILGPRKGDDGLVPLGRSREHTALSICGGCAAGCSVKLRIAHGNIVGIVGNPLDPIGLGGLCARGVSEIEAFYDPDRLVGPIKRSGDRGTGRWEALDWEVGLSEIAERMAKVADAGQGSRIAAVLSSPRGSNAAMITQTLKAFGSSRVYHESNLRDVAMHGLVDPKVQGGAWAPTIDLANADHILSFGTPLLESWLSPAYVARRYGDGRAQLGGRRNPLRLQQIESHCSPTAMRADRWVRCRPGREGFVALGVASVIVSEHQADAAALNLIRTTIIPASNGVWGRKTLFEVLTEAFTPQKVEAASGVKTEVLRQLAHGFVNAERPVAVGEKISGSAGVLCVAAANILNVLRGRVEVPGGLIWPEAPSVSSQKAFVHNGSLWQQLAKNETTDPIEVLFIEDVAALGDVVPGDPVFEQLKKIPLIVSFAGAIDGSARVADFILPGATNFEQALDVEHPPVGGFKSVAVARRAVKPITKSKPLGEIFAALAKHAGKLAPQSADKTVSARVEALAGRGMAYTHMLAEYEFGEKIGSSKNNSAKSIIEAGGWVSMTTRDTNPRAKSQIIIDAMAKSLAAKQSVPNADSDQATSADVLTLVPTGVGAMAGRGTPNRPSLLQQAAPRVHAGFHPWAEINPRDALVLGITEGTKLRVKSEHATTVVTAYLYAGVRPGSIAIPWAPSVVGSGRYAKAWTGGAEQLTSRLSSPNDVDSCSHIQVRVSPIQGGASE